MGLSKIKICKIIMAIALVFVVSVLIRNTAYKKEVSAIGHFIPYTFSSAEQYKDIRSISESGVGVEEKLDLGNAIFAQFYYTANIIDDSISAGDYDMGISLNRSIVILTEVMGGIVAVLLFALLLKINLGVITATLLSLLFSLLPISLGKFTGSAISNEIFAIPFLLILLLSFYMFETEKGKFNLIVSSIAAVLSIMLWPGSQVFIVLLMLGYGLYLIIQRNNEIFRAQEMVFILSFIVLGYFVCNTLKIEFYLEPISVVLMVCSTLLVYLRNKIKIDLPSYVSLYFVVFLGVLVLGGVFNLFGSYNSFPILVYTKIINWNFKPLSCTALPFSLKYLWSAPYTSASIMGSWLMLHFLLVVAAISLFVGLANKKARNILLSQNSIIFIPLIILMVGSAVLYTFFEGFGVIFALILILLSGVCISSLFKVSNKVIKVIISVLLILVCLAELEWISSLQNANSDSNKLQGKLISWFNHSTSSRNENILANYNYSSLLYAYSGIKPVMTSNKLDENNKENIKEYLSAIYSSNEDNLLNYCKKHNVDYVLFSMDMFIDFGKDYYTPRWSPQYLAGFNVVNKDSVAYLMAKKPTKLKYFFKVDQQMHRNLSEFFSIYKVIQKDQLSQAKELTIKAENSFNNGELEDAKLNINYAVNFGPNIPETRFLYYQIYGKWPLVTIQGVKNITL